MIVVVFIIIRRFLGAIQITFRRGDGDEYEGRLGHHATLH